MKKIINNKTYNTETATLIEEISEGCTTDFNYYSEELYQKKTGEFFIYGEGGAMSRYAQSIDQNNWSGGEAIRPTSTGEAKTWLSDNDFISVYIKLFGEPKE